MEEKFTGLDFFEAQAVTKCARMIRYKNNPWCRFDFSNHRAVLIYDGIVRHDDRGFHHSWWPNLQQQKTKKWEVEPEKPKKSKDIFVWGAGEDNGEGWLHPAEPHRDADGWICNDAEGRIMGPFSKNIFPKDKPQKFRLVPADQPAIPWRKFVRGNQPPQIGGCLVQNIAGQRVSYNFWTPEGWRLDGGSVVAYCPLDEIPLPEEE